MTLRGLAAGAAGWFGREPVLEFTDWPGFERRAGTEQAGSPASIPPSNIARASTGRGCARFAPRHSRFEALHQALDWLVASGEVDAGGQEF